MSASGFEWHIGEKAITAVTTVVAAVVGFIWREVRGLSSKQSAHERHVGETYVRQESFNQASDRLHGRLERVENKQDEQHGEVMRVLIDLSGRVK